MLLTQKVYRTQKDQMGNLCDRVRAQSQELPRPDMWCAESGMARMTTADERSQAAESSDDIYSAESLAVCCITRYSR
jgi:hypothetical protein